METDQSSDKGRSVILFDHHGPELAARGHDLWSELQGQCPAAWTDAYGGFWVITSYDGVATVARDDGTFSSVNDLGQGPRTGVTVPGAPIPSGLIETDPPRFTKLRRALNPWFGPSAVERLRPAMQQDIKDHIDRFLERGRGDLVDDLASPVPASLTIRLLGLAPELTPKIAHVMHRAIYVPHDSEDRPAVDADTGWLIGLIYEEVQKRVDVPTDDFLSFIANLEIDGVRLPVAEAAGNAWLFIAGGVDTTTALLANSLIHLEKDRQARAWLQEDLSRLRVACEEYLRYFSPVQGLTRYAQQSCPVAGQVIEAGDKVLMSWAAANIDPAQFDDPTALQLDRFPNRHVAFGLGAHRCLGSNVARLVWISTMEAVLTRMPDYKVLLDQCEPYTSIGVVNGWAHVPAHVSG